MDERLHVARNRARAAVICAWLASMLAAYAVKAIDDHYEHLGQDAPPAPSEPEHCGKYRWSDERARGYQQGYDDAVNGHAPVRE
jgi:hypothetical protein